MSGKNKRQALGRGLDALLGSNELIDRLSSNDNKHTAIATNKSDASANANANKDVKSSSEKHTTITAEFSDGEQGVIGAIAAIDINLIDVNPKQPRTQFEDSSLKELSESIKGNGIIQPLTVRKQGKRYQLISGERRLRASKLAGLQEVPVYIRMVSENEMLEMGLVENIQREDLNALDIALSYQALVDVYKYSQEEVSKKVGKERSTVANYMRLLKLPAEVQFALRDNKISMGHARALLSIEDAEKQVDWVRKIVEKGHSVRFVEQSISQKKQDKDLSGRAASDSILPDWCIRDSRELSEKLETLVEVKKNRAGKGSLQIKFSSEEELQTILSKLNA